MVLRLYNTLSREIQEFQPLTDRQVGLYSCGPTVYNFAHIGNLRAFFLADILKRALLANDFRVTHIMNITDVGHLTGDRDMGEDKLALAARESRKSAWEIASYYTESFLADIKAVNIILADKYPRATDHIKDMISLIRELEARGFTYQTSGGIYFDTGKLPDYGKLGKLDIAGLREGARVEINNEKRNPTDFALWKFSLQDGKRDMEWHSPWGLGFPGWHVECSAMSVKYLGQPFDIHTGGADHIPVHHTNEIAQSEAAAGKPLANFWLHNEHLLIKDEKIAKSLGNTLHLQDLKDKGFSPLAFRYFVLQGHYRTRLNFTWQALAGAQNSLNNLYEKLADFGPASAGWRIGCAEYEKDFLAAINDDLNTPQALAVMWNMLDSDYPGEAKLASLLEMDKILGLSTKEVWKSLQSPIPEEISKLVQEREAMREEKNWDGADEVRQKIEDMGYLIKDTDQGPKVTKKLI